MVTATGAREQLKHMIGNLERWASNPNVLHISLEHLLKDYNKSIECVFNFLGLDTPTPLEHLQAVSPKNAEPRKIASGVVSKEQLCRLLEKHPSIALPLNASRALAWAVHRRQSYIYECPVPNHC